MRCAVCGRALPPGHEFRGGIHRCRRHALTFRPMLRRSLSTALVVGSLLTAINQGNRILESGLSAEVLLKMALTYCVPFCVATYGALSATAIARE